MAIVQPPLDMYKASTMLGFVHSDTENNMDRMFSELPSDPNQLNVTMCGPYNRTGLLCGRCIDEYGPAVYSVDMKCANCSRLSTGYAISVYVLLELIPVTLVFICMIIFRINITAGPLLGYVIFCQVYVFYFKTYLYIYEYILSHVSAQLRVLFYSSLTLSGSWSLQFGRFVIPPFCISSKLTGIHIQMLNLVTAIYSIVLLVIICILMELHARNCRIVHIVWKPFSIFLTKFKITKVTRYAVIHAFATFILLSSLTLTFNTSTFVIDNTVQQSNPDGTGRKTVLYFDPTIVRFSHKHISYMVAAMVPFIFLVLIPSLLLCVYPTKIYRCLSRFVSGRKRLAITAFAEALHNCYKDGLNGTRDYRAMAGLSILGFPVSAVINYAVRKTIANGYSAEAASGYTLVFISLVISYVRPCKKTIANLSLSYHYFHDVRNSQHCPSPLAT